MPSSYLSPGVYVEEVSSGSKPIEAAGTAVAAFVGFAERGPVNQPVLVTNWTQFVQVFGDFIEGSYLAHAVYGFFLNGGGSCYVVRIGGNGAAPPARGELPLGRDKALPYRAIALEPGGAGNDLVVEGLAGSVQLEASKAARLRAAGEAFADRRYLPDGSLMPRSQTGAVLHDSAEAAEQALRIVRERAVIASDGSKVAIDAQTLCLHGDTPGASAIAAAVRKALESAGVAIAAL